MVEEGEVLLWLVSVILDTFFFVGGETDLKGI